MDENLQRAGYSDVATITDGGGSYDWAEMHVYTSSDGRVFISGQGGCSCSSWEDPRLAMELTEVGDLTAARREWTQTMLSYDNSELRWLDHVRPVFAGLGLS